MQGKGADHIRGQGNIKGRASLRPNTGFWTPLGDRARRDLADRRLDQRRLARLVSLGRATRFPLDMRVCSLRRASRRGAAPGRNC